ncbi:MAG: metallophosphoesterase [Clostridia bacterium]|nr:metallophosphoesterase [Clostridia bacterium]
MKWNRFKKTLLALAVTFCLLLPVPAAFATGTKNDTSVGTLKVMSLSDTHLLLRSMIKNTEDYQHDMDMDQKVYNESEAVLDAQLRKVRETKPDVLLLSGDLTKDGEYRGHEAIAAKLRALKKDLPSLKVYVANGNHDINNSNAKDFNTPDGKAVPARKTTPEDFRALYADISFEDPSVREVYSPPAGAKAGGLSYMARPKKGFTIIVIDSNRYSPDNTETGEAEHDTSGKIPEDLLQWIKRKISNARKRGDTVIGVQHHNVVAHFTMEPNVMGAFLVNDYSHIAKTYADTGLHYLFTGHMHAQDVSFLRTEAGNELYDIETGSSITYPCPLRTVTFQRAGTDPEADNGVRETVTGASTQNLRVSFRDPQTGDQKTIPDMTAYTKGKGLTPKVISTILEDMLQTKLGNTYPEALNNFIETLIFDLMNVPVTKEGSHTVYDAFTYAHMSHLDGTDDGNDPAWYREAMDNLSEGKVLAGLTDVLCRDLAGLSNRNADLLYHGLFGAANISYYTAPQIAQDLNEFLYKLMMSLSHDTNYNDDVSFRLERGNVPTPGHPDNSSVENGLEHNLICKVVSAALKPKA